MPALPPGAGRLAARVFNWTPARMARLRSAVRSFNRALTMRARELTAMGLGSLVGNLPKRESVEAIMDEVRDVNDYRRIVGYASDAKHGRTARLTRVLKSVRPDALDFVEDPVTGRVETNYARREYRNDRAAIVRERNRTARDMVTAIRPGDEPVDVTPEMYSSNDLMPADAGEPDDSVEDVDAGTLDEWRREDARRKRDAVTVDAMYGVYRDVWTNPLNFHSAMPGYQQLLDALDWLAEYRPDVLNKEFAKSPDELDPKYIIESDETYAYIPYETRHNRAVAYVTGVARDCGWRPGLKGGPDSTGRLLNG